MKTPGKTPVVATSNFNDELRAAFAASKKREIADKEEESLFEGAD